MNKERRIKNNIFLISIITYCIIYFGIIVNKIPNYATTINGIFISIIAFIAYLVYGFQKIELNKIRKKIILEVIIAIFIYFTLIFGLGYFTGFLKNAYSLNILAIIRHIIIPLISIIALEMFRYIFISTNRDSLKYIAVMTILLIGIDTSINYYLFDYTPLEIFTFISVTIIPIIFKNIVLSYLSYQIGYHPCLIYVVPLCLYKYFIPILPDLGDYLTCAIGIILPSMIYLYASRMISENLNGKESKIKTIRIFVLDIPLVIIFTIFIGLISGYFSYHLIGIDTSAISPKVNKGDAVMLYKNINIKDIDVGSIIAYQKSNEIIIDVVSKKEDNEIYVKSEKISDNEYNYTILKSDDIIGLYKFRIEKVAYPTIWFKDLLKG